MKTGIKLTVCAAAAAIALTMAVFTLAGFSPSCSPPAQMQQAAVKDAGFVLGEKDGSIAVYPAGGGEPLVITNISLDRLRESDRELIRAGLPAASEDELLRLLEDFGS
jgi:hypothetical protein